MNFKNKKQRDALGMQHAAFPSASFGVGNTARCIPKRIFLIVFYF